MNRTFLNPFGDKPQVDPTTYIDPTARIIGNVRIGPGCYIGPQAVVRADEPDTEGKVAPIIISGGCNVQDGAVIHALAGCSVFVGEKTSLGHKCLVHGPAEVGANCFIGFGVTIFKATIQEWCFIGHHAIIQEVDIPPHSSVHSAYNISHAPDLECLKKTTPGQEEFIADVAKMNHQLAEGYRRLAEGK